jgi:hypothetical protein
MPTGDYPISGVVGLALIDLAFPGEVWTDLTASGTVLPGEAVVPVSVGGKSYVRTAKSGDTALGKLLTIAMRTPGNPDPNTGPASLGPNAVMNQPIPQGEYVRRWSSGGFNTTLFVPTSTYVPGVSLVGWNPAGARPVGIAGTGAWDLSANCPEAFRDIFQVRRFEPIPPNAGEGILTFTSLRGQF